MASSAGRVRKKLTRLEESDPTVPDSAAASKTFYSDGPALFPAECTLLYFSHFEWTYSNLCQRVRLFIQLSDYANFVFFLFKATFFVKI
jgi:hypothetical protein